MNVRCIHRLIAVTVVGASLMACGSSDDDGSSADTSTTAAPAPTTAAPAPTTAAPAPTTAAPVPTTAAPAPTTAAPAPTTGVPGGGSATCDEESVAAGIGDDVAEILDLECDQGWAGAYYTDNAGLSRPAILEAEGEFWILQDWNEVCQGDPMVPGDIAVPESLRVYCPGG